LASTADDSRAAYDGWIQRNADEYKFLMTFDPAGRDGWKQSVFATQYTSPVSRRCSVIDRDGKISETVSGGGPGEDYRLEIRPGPGRRQGRPGARSRPSPRRIRTRRNRSRRR
jgi:hypothetical protein